MKTIVGNKKTNNHYDANLPEKVKCAYPGCTYEDHILVEHLKAKHGIDDLAEDYMEKYDAPLWSTFGLQKFKEAHKEDANLQMQPRPRKSLKIKAIFPELKKHVEDDEFYDIFATRGEKTPPVNKGYVFPPDQLIAAMVKLEKPRRNRLWIAGPTGTGKTQFALNLAARVNAEVWRLNCDAHMKRSDLIGSWTLRGQETVFQYGVLPLAMMEGAWLIVDEIDTLRPDLMNLFKPALEDEARLLIPEYGGKIIIAHPDFRIIATANTFGRGDDTGLYVSTMTQSKADLRRFNCFIKMDYLPEKTEIEIVVKTFKGEVTEKEALSFVKVANDIRAAYTAGKVDVPFSIDELLNWVDTWISVNDLHVAANLCFLNACAPDVVVAINAIIDQHWDEGEEPADPNAQVKP